MQKPNISNWSKKHFASWSNGIEMASSQCGSSGLMGKCDVSGKNVGIIFDINWEQNVQNK